MYYFDCDGISGVCICVDLNLVYWIWMGFVYEHVDSHLSGAVIDNRHHYRSRSNSDYDDDYVSK